MKMTLFRLIVLKIVANLRTNHIILCLAGFVGNSAAFAMPDYYVDRIVLANEETTEIISTAEPGQTFKIAVRIKNAGEPSSGNTNRPLVRYYQSDNTNITSSDTQLGTDLTNHLEGNDFDDESLILNAPDTPGTYHYGACVTKDRESSSTNIDCSNAVTLTVESNEPAPADYYIDLITLTNDETTQVISTAETGQSFKIAVRVKNHGGPSSGNAFRPLVRYYSSHDTNITSSDTQLGTDLTNHLEGNDFDDESLALTAPETPGTYYYGACVTKNRQSSSNNFECSDNVTLSVSEAESSSPTLSLLSTSETEMILGSTFSVSVSASDNDSDLKRITFDWGDSLITNHDLSGESYSETHLHDYANEGTYSWQAFVTDNAGNRSNLISGTVTVSDAPDAPTLSGGVFIQKVPDGFYLNWNVASGTVTNYRLYRSTSAGIRGNQIFSGNENDYLDTNNLFSGTTYYYTASACNNTSCGDSDQSSEIYIEAVEGLCGNANGKVYQVNVESYGSDQQCSSGSLSNSSFPLPGQTASWTCSGDGVQMVSCSASRENDTEINISFVIHPSVIDKGFKSSSINEVTESVAENFAKTISNYELKFEQETYDSEFEYTAPDNGNSSDFCQEDIVPKLAFDEKEASKQSLKEAIVCNLVKNESDPRIGYESDAVIYLVRQRIISRDGGINGFVVRIPNPDPEGSNCTGDKCLKTYKLGAMPFAVVTIVDDDDDNRSIATVSRTILHEVGHLFGLKHGHEDSGPPGYANGQGYCSADYQSVMYSTKECREDICGEGSTKEDDEECGFDSTSSPNRFYSVHDSSSPSNHQNCGDSGSADCGDSTSNSSQVIKNNAPALADWYWLNSAETE